MAPSGTGYRLSTCPGSLGSTTRIPSLVSSVADSSSRVSTTLMFPLVPSSYSTSRSAYSSPLVYFTVPSDPARPPPPLGLLRDARGGAADVEGSEGELGARLADGLGRQDADRLAHVTM